MPDLQDDARPVGRADREPDARRSSARGSPPATRRARSSGSSSHSSDRRSSPRRPEGGFNLLAWVLPFVGLGSGAGAVAVARVALSRGRLRRRSRQPGPPLDPEVERRLDDELARFDSLSELPVAFSAGFISLVTPCVLPLVPGYLSAVSAVEASGSASGGDRGGSSLASMPFILGFTVVFVLLGAGAAAIGERLREAAQNEIAGFVLVVSGSCSSACSRGPSALSRRGCSSGARSGFERAARRRLRRVRRPVHRRCARLDPRARGELGGCRARCRSTAPRTRSASVPHSSSPAWPSQGRWDGSAGSATSTGSSRSPAA